MFIIHLYENIEKFINLNEFLRHMFIETIIGSPAKVKVLRILLENKIAYSMLDIQKLSGLSIGVIHKVITLLKEERIIAQKKGKGKQRFYQINPGNKYLSKLSAIFDEEKIDRRSIPVHIWNMLEILCSELKTKLKGIRSIILFGSLAKGEFRINSDIDLLIITKEHFKDETKARGLCRNKTMKNSVNPIFMAEPEFETHKAKKSDFFESIMKEGLRLA